MPEPMLCFALRAPARARREELVTTIAALEHYDTRRFDRTAIQRRISAHLDSWRSLLATKQVEDGRRLL